MQAPGGEGDSNFDSPNVAQSDLVPTAIRKLIDLPILLPPTQNIVTNSEGLSHPMVMEGHQGAWPVSGDPTTQKDQVISIIRKSWRGSTESAYSSAWQQCDSWCL